MDPKKRARILAIEPGSPAERRGWQAGDEIVSLAGQPILSIADVQWVLHNSGNETELTADVRRNSQMRSLTLPLDRGWRRRGDISWRAGSWDLRRMTTGGMRLDDLSSEERRRLNLPDDVLALRARYVGEYGEHATAKNAGFRKGDVLIELDGRATRLTESQWMTLLVNEKRPGDRVAVVVLRDGQRLSLELPMK
jgi:S1-C subfamily serine protease